MKRTTVNLSFLKRMLCAICVIALLFSVLALPVFTRLSDKIVVIKGIRFGMTPSEVRSVLGEPKEVKNYDTLAETMSLYDFSYCGYIGTVGLYFGNGLIHKQLHKASIIFHVSGEQAQLNLLNELLKAVEEEYAGRNDMVIDGNDKGYTIQVRNPQELISYSIVSNPSWQEQDCILFVANIQR